MSKEQTDWVLVPREPTQEMVDAWPRHNHGAGHERAIYRAMIAASPTPPPRDGEGDLVARLRALGEDDFYASPATCYRVVNEAAIAIESLSRQLEEAREALTAADDARTRLSNYADAANSGQAQAGGRELKRKIWGAFSDYDRIRAKETVSHG